MTPRPCHGPRCTAALESSAKPFCQDCWEKLPHAQQLALWRAWRKTRTSNAGGADYSDALAKAKKFLNAAQGSTRQAVH